MCKYIFLFLFVQWKADFFFVCVENADSRRFLQIIIKLRMKNRANHLSWNEVKHLVYIHVDASEIDFVERCFFANAQNDK